MECVDSTPIISRIPSSPTPRRNKHPEDQSNLPVSPTKSSTLLGPNAPEYRQKGIGQHEQQPSVQPTLMAKKKKKGQRVGYAREPEMPAGGKLRENIQSHSAGSGVDVRPGSQQSQARTNCTKWLVSSQCILQALMVWSKRVAKCNSTIADTFE